MKMPPGFFSALLDTTIKMRRGWYYLGIAQTRLGALAPAKASLLEATRLNARFERAPRHLFDDDQAKRSLEDFSQQVVNEERG